MPTTWIEAQRVADCMVPWRGVEQVLEVDASGSRPRSCAAPGAAGACRAGVGRCPAESVAGRPSHHIAAQGEHHPLRLDGAQAVPEENLIDGDDVGGESRAQVWADTPAGRASRAAARHAELRAGRRNEAISRLSLLDEPAASRPDTRG